MPSMRGIVPEQHPCAPSAYARSTPQARSHARDDAHLGQALPGQAEHECIELRLGQRQGLGRDYVAWPQEATAVEPARRAPHAEAVVHEQLDAAGARWRTDN